MTDFRRYPAWKRAMDLGIAFFSAVAFLPLFPLIAIAIKVDSKGPVFAKCERISGGKKIRVYKFRSMVKDAELMKNKFMHMNNRSEGPFFKIKEDPRVTRVGKFLRAYRIDEVPQIINVLKGNMAIVGPRPHEPEEVDQYPEKYKELSLYRAGITGISQVSGASSLNWLKELELDMDYIKNISFKKDMAIILKTIFIFFFDPTGI
ncbi:MAG: sugar transferase [Candidatus Colwellbacteria bacterium]|jgi:lipopolysaccharide/colanic/teichoic acid biosynthesis glycosyltransferase|nr:sugar transferase [Candidatus Colwellbacteria bacterium]MCK9497831.1 sugar transferase [Candidatus Colwellbacteria bacterium]MDD3752602.1 sugar transferase [Candidatus Colwellbacteria bacterium]MDD4818863.1 sugar transferase [Candidatus Colwellbacteria bacterium]